MSKEDFNKVWRDSSRDSILNQFYYEHYDLLKCKKAIDKAKIKLYEWGEALDPKFQKVMLDILNEVSDE